VREEKNRKKEKEGEKRTYVEKVSKNDIRLIFGKLDNSLCECLVNENGLPSSDSYYSCQPLLYTST
jgi:hypothetical protein